MTISALFDSRTNSLNAIRLLLASMVIVSHSIPLGGYGVENNFYGMNLGTWAVLGFFSISGFLITRSRLTRKTSEYFRARTLRILPGYVVSLIVVAFVFAPISVLIEPRSTWDIGSALSYILRNLALYPPYIAQQGIGTTIATVAFPGVWNGPLWTLFWEALCYVMISLMVTLVPQRALRWFCLTVFILISTLAVITVFGVVNYNPVIERAWPMILAFLSGALLYIFRNELRLGIVVAISGTLFVLGLLTNSSAALAPLGIAVAMLTLGRYLHLEKVGTKRDISFGVYIYGWPVQQLLAAAGLGELVNAIVFSIVAIAATIPLSFLSFVIIERPAMGIGRPSKPKMTEVF